MGFGIGIPLFLLTAFGGLFIGVVIEEIEKMKNNKVASWKTRLWF